MGVRTSYRLVVDGRKRNIAVNVDQGIAHLCRYTILSDQKPSTGAESLK